MVERRWGGNRERGRTRAAVVAAMAAMAAMAWTAGLAFAATWTPPDNTITKVSGSKRSGFQVSRYDGSRQYLPTLSEAVAECGEYSTRVDRVRCRAAVRAQYTGLGQTKRAIRYARSR